MTAKRLPGAIGLALLMIAGPALAEDESELTMTLMGNPDVELPEAVTRYIELPEQASEEALERSEHGLETANEARQRREEGLETAAEARERGQELGGEMRERGQELGAEMRDAAQERRENLGRGPEDVERPEPPERPELTDQLPVTPPAGPPGAN